MARYFIAVVPQEPLQGQLTEIKKHFAETYQSKGALRSPAHITLHMPFDLDGKKEERFLSGFQSFKCSIDPFKIELNNFSCFEPRVIFIAVKHCETLNALQGSYVELMKKEYHIFNQSDDLRAFHPHVTVAFRDLKKPAFYEAWKEFEQKQFSGTFECNAVSLLRLETQGWIELQRIQLLYVT